MQDRRGFLGNLLGGSAASLLLPASVAKASIEVIGDKELISRIEDTKGRDIVLANDETLAQSAWSGSFFGASIGTLMKLSARNYESFLHDHLKINRRYGIPSMVESEMDGWTHGLH